MREAVFGARLFTVMTMGRVWTCISVVFITASGMEAAHSSPAQNSRVVRRAGRLL